VRPEGWAAARALFPAATLETLPDAGHWVHAEDPDGFVAAVDRFARAA
jgi:pimeloyl-ACP methyl ester carboxylesterase